MKNTVSAFRQSFNVARTLIASTRVLQIAGRSWKTSSFAFLFCAAAISANAATWYVDKSATGVHNGTSWANAWASVSSVTGVAAGDTVYISGGSAGSSQTYTGISNWTPQGGALGNPVTYKIGQDAAHNGNVIFDGAGTGRYWLFAANNVIVSGDAGDGAQHFYVTNYTDLRVYCDSSVGVRVSYIYFGMSKDCLRFNGAKVVEVDHCVIVKTVDPTEASDFAINLVAVNGGNWDVNKIHDNIIALPREPSGYGDDGIQSGSGMSVYNNTIYGYITNNFPIPGQHQDGIQTEGSFNKIYNNTFHDLGNSGVFIDIFNSMSNCYVFNNVFYNTVAQTGGAIQFGPDGGSGLVTLVNCVVANNTIADWGAENYAIGFWDPSKSKATFVNCVAANNLSYNSAGMQFAVNGQIKVVYNKAIAGASGNSGISPANSAGPGGDNNIHFVSYIERGLNNKFQLASNDTACIDAGTDMSAYFNFDHDGNVRPQGRAWDIGAYEYTGSSGGGVISSNLPPTVSAITQNASDVDAATAGLQIYSGTTVQYSGSATVLNLDPITWQWSYTVNGGASVVFQAGTGVIPAVSFTYAAATVGNTYVWTLSVTDTVTHLSAQSQMTMSVEAPPVAGSGLTFQAGDGLVTAPFTLAGGSFSQAIQTTVVASSGSASYNFTLTNAGNYVIQALVNAPSDAGNSLFVNIDAQPVDPTMVWDMLITNGFEQRLVSWRGTGSDTSNQFVPKVFNLSAGPHQIIFRGREAGVSLQSFSILAVPNPPQNLRILPTVVTTGP